MYTSNNVNDNAVLGTKTNNDNVIERAKGVEAIANQLVEKFGSPESRPFYCKVAYALPENKILSNLLCLKLKAVVKTYKSLTSKKIPTNITRRKRCIDVIIN